MRVHPGSPSPKAGPRLAFRITTITNFWQVKAEISSILGEIQRGVTLWPVIAFIRQVRLERESAKSVCCWTYSFSQHNTGIRVPVLLAEDEQISCMYCRTHNVEAFLEKTAMVGDSLNRTTATFVLAY